MKRLLLIIALVLLGVLALVEQSERWTYSLPTFGKNHTFAA